MCVRVDYPDNRAVGGCLIAFERKRRFLAPTPKDQFAFTRSNGVERDRRRSLWLKVGIERLHDQKLSPVERSVFYRGNNSSDDAGYLHSGLFFQIGNRRLDLINVWSLWSKVNIFLQLSGRIGILLFHDVYLSKIQMS